MENNDGSHDFTGSTAYCWQFNSDGYCVTCGAPKNDNRTSGRWPTHTWFQRRRAQVIRESVDVKEEE